jgi:hypothetical protein
LFNAHFDVVDCGGKRESSELTVLCSRLDGGAVRALDHRVDDLSQQPLDVEFVLDPCVVRVILRCEDAMLDQRTDAFSAEFFAEAHIVVALVAGETPQILLYVTLLSPV